MHAPGLWQSVGNPYNRNLSGCWFSSLVRVSSVVGGRLQTFVIMQVSRDAARAVEVGPGRFATDIETHASAYY